MMMRITVDTVVEIKHTIFELFFCMSLDLFALFSCVNKEVVLFVVASIQGWLLLFFFNQFMWLLFKGGFYSRKYGR